MTIVIMFVKQLISDFSNVLDEFGVSKNLLFYFSFLGFSYAIIFRFVSFDDFLLSCMQTIAITVYNHTYKILAILVTA